MSVKNKKSKASHTGVTIHRFCGTNRSLTPEAVRSEACLDDPGPAVQSRFRGAGGSSGPLGPFYKVSGIGIRVLWGIKKDLG